MDVWNKHKDDWSILSEEEQQVKENPLDETDAFLLKLFNGNVKVKEEKQHLDRMKKYLF